MTLPIVTEKANVSNSILEFTPVFLASCNITGVPMIARVSFNKMADRKPAPNRIRSSKLLGGLCSMNRWMGEMRKISFLPTPGPG
jgi:hypothetical protein